MKPTNSNHAGEDAIYADDAVLLYDVCPGLDYSGLLEFIGRLCQRPGSVFDVGCGTGSLLAQLAEKGWQGAGCDPSTPMVNAARQKAPRARISRATATDFEVAKPVDLVTCTSDVVNHLPSQAVVGNFFRRAFESLAEGGVLLFDTLTPYDINVNWDDYAQISRLENAYVIRTGKKLRPCIGELTYDFFMRQEDGNWRHKLETHRLHAWHRSWIEQALHATGFSEQVTVDAETLAPPGRRAVRWMVAARRPVR